MRARRDVNRLDSHLVGPVSLVPHVSPFPPVVPDVRTLEVLACRHSFSAACKPALFMTVRREIAQSPRETGARSREAGNTPPGGSDGGGPPSGGFVKGAG